jgi:succinyl-diaminopimelate desuccinylase
MAPAGTSSTDLPSRPAADLVRRLAARTLELVDIASESGAERNIADHVLRVLRDGEVPARDAGDSCILAGATGRGERPFVLLVGHLDTVPAQGNLPGRLTAGGTPDGRAGGTPDGRAGGAGAGGTSGGTAYVEGLGAADMKGGVAVMLELALGRAGTPQQGRFDLGYVLFGREELPAAQGALGPLLAREPGLRDADLAIVLEPTANAVHAGCLGNLDAAWTFRGRAGHSARPWLADNAIDRAADGVAALRAIEPSTLTVAGLDYAHAVSVTTLHAGVARNTIPGAATANVNYRYHPGVAPEQAERALRAWCEPHGEVELLCNTPGAPPPADNQLLRRLVDASAAAIQAKQAWTPVAELAGAGIDAVNLGPGDPALAHRPDERVATAALARTHEILEAFLCA